MQGINGGDKNKSTPSHTSETVNNVMPIQLNSKFEICSPNVQTIEPPGARINMESNKRSQRFYEIYIGDGF